MPRTCVGQHFISDQKVNIGFSLMYTQHKDLQNDFAIDLSILEQSGLPAGGYPIQPERVPGKWHVWSRQPAWSRQLMLRGTGCKTSLWGSACHCSASSRNADVILWELEVGPSRSLPVLC